MSKDEFLDKLPKNVIKNGKIIPVRDEIAKKMSGNNNNNNGLPPKVVNNNNK